MDDEIVSYRGKPVEEMTREELVEAVKWLTTDWSRLMSAAATRARPLGEFQMMMRGERAG